MALRASEMRFQSFSGFAASPGYLPARPTMAIGMTGSGPSEEFPAARPFARGVVGATILQTIYQCISRGDGNSASRINYIDSQGMAL